MSTVSIPKIEHSTILTDESLSWPILSKDFVAKIHFSLKIIEKHLMLYSMVTEQKCTFLPQNAITNND